MSSYSPHKIRYQGLLFFFVFLLKDFHFYLFFVYIFFYVGKELDCIVFSHIQPLTEKEVSIRKSSSLTLNNDCQFVSLGVFIMNKCYD